MLTCQGCGSAFPRGRRGPAGRFCSAACKSANVRQLRNATSNYWQVDKHTIFERDDWTCKLCGNPVKEGMAWPHPMSPSLDHVVPVIRGGTNEMTNLQLAHLVCNMRKGASDGVMGARGPLPTAVIVAPKPRPGVPDRPEWLSDAAKAEWDRVAGDLDARGLLSLVDGAALTGYCQAYARWIEAEIVLTREGMTYETSSGYVRPRPEVGIAQQYLKLAKELGAAFGLSPASRGRLLMPDPAEDDENDPFDA